MNYRFKANTGQLTVEHLVLDPGVTQTLCKSSIPFERQGDAQQFEWYILQQRLLNRQAIFSILLCYEREDLRWIEIHRDKERDYGVEVLSELKKDMLPNGGDNFLWGSVSIPGNLPEDKFLCILYNQS